MFLANTTVQWKKKTLLPDAPSLCVIIQHSVPFFPDDVLRLLADNVLHHAFELDGRAAVVEDSLFHLLVTLVHDLDCWH